MPMRLNVGASRKVTDNNYGSRGASVNLELELDSTLVSEPTKLQEKIRYAFQVVRTSLAQELNGGHSQAASGNESASPDRAAPRPNGSSPSQRNGVTRIATLAQIKALYGLARWHGADLRALMRDRWKVERPEELTLRQASSLIDTLKDSDCQSGS